MDAYTLTPEPYAIYTLYPELCIMDVCLRGCMCMQVESLFKQQADLNPNPEPRNPKLYTMYTLMYRYTLCTTQI